MTRRHLACTLPALLLSLSPAWADAPVASYIFPVGGQRGKSVDVTFLGGNLKEPVKVHVDASASPEKHSIPVNLPGPSPLGPRLIQPNSRARACDARRGRRSPRQPIIGRCGSRRDRILR